MWSTQTKSPTGLINLGNTCYANASIQALRSLPELRTALDSYGGAQSNAGMGDGGLTRAMKSLWDGMGRTTEGFPPMAFLNVSPFVRSAVTLVSPHRGR